MTFRLGLTGSIGMGKSTTARLFADEGVPVWDADAAVHRLYSAGGAAIAPITALHPAALQNGAVDRQRLKAWLAIDPQAFAQIEAVVHPLVAADRDAFTAAVSADMIVLDIPLLFEKGIDTTLDATLLVTAPPALQRRRVLARPGMTEQQFQLILSRQMPDAEKRSRATHILETLSEDSARAYIRALLSYIRANHA